MRTTLLLALALMSVSCQRLATVDVVAEEQAIREASSRFDDLVAARNDSAIAALYTTDVVILPPGMASVTGQQAAREMWAGFWSMNPTLTASLTTVTVSRGGDLATTVGTWNLSWADSTGATMQDSGPFLSVWTKTESGWRIKQDIWNSSAATP